MELERKKEEGESNEVREEEGNEVGMKRKKERMR